MLYISFFAVFLCSKTINKQNTKKKCSIDEKEKKILSLPPKFAVYNRVNTTQCEAEIEKGLAKLRWTKRKQFEMDGENKDQTEEERRAVYDIKSKTFVFL